MSELAVIGAGAWGTALSIVLGRKALHRVRLWAHDPAICDQIGRMRVNEKFLPGCAIPSSVTVTHNVAEALAGAQFVITAVPSQYCREMFERMRPHLFPETPVISATKGLEQKTHMRMTEVIVEILGKGGEHHPRVGALSGPSFALEAACGDPTAVVIASHDPEFQQMVQREFSDSRFRVYTNSDVVGVELGGALKNVIAIAAGICDGLGLGHNSVAALITRGLAEMTRLVVACGGRAETMAGLAGLGDLVLTCTGQLSRNRHVGVELGRGRKLLEIIEAMHGSVAEGIHTTSAAAELAFAHGIDIPITLQMKAILWEGKSPHIAIEELMARRGKGEGDARC